MKKLLLVLISITFLVSVVFMVSIQSQETAQEKENVASASGYGEGTATQHPTSTPPVIIKEDQEK